MLKEPHSFHLDDRLSEYDKAQIAELNECLRRLSQRRAVELTRSGAFARSKIAWKLAYYEHALLHRIVALADGVAATWNCRCTLSALLSARALMETFAVLWELREGIRQSLASEDLKALDMIARAGLFATRDEEIVKVQPETKAINALTYVQKFDRIAAGFGGHYNRLSERCHPNAYGHNYMFSELDRTDATVRFTAERDPEANRKMLLAALTVLPRAEAFVSDIENSIAKVAELQHRIFPVREDD